MVQVAPSQEIALSALMATEAPASQGASSCFWEPRSTSLPASTSFPFHTSREYDSASDSKSSSHRSLGVLLVSENTSTCTWLSSETARMT